MLVVHFIGLAMGLGTGFAMMFLGKAAAKLEPAKRGEFMQNALAVTRMGHIGLGLLILSGGYLMTPYWSMLMTTPLLLAKLALVLVVTGLVGYNTMLGKRLLVGDPAANMRRLKSIGTVTLLSVMTVVVMAVLVFH